MKISIIYHTESGNSKVIAETMAAAGAEIPGV